VDLIREKFFVKTLTSWEIYQREEKIKLSLALALSCQVYCYQQTQENLGLLALYGEKPENKAANPRSGQYR
jgi:hypothetical protein